MASKEQQELVEKIQKLLKTKYGDASVENMRKLFDAYDKDGDKRIGAPELEQLLKDADVGNSFTRGAWVKGVIGALDTNSDKTIDWDEFSNAVK
jgi:Ca2+-binding EF-hand superfamily protein